MALHDLELADWRRRVADLYRLPTLETFRDGRDLLFADHPQSPIPAAERAAFAGLDWYPPDPRYAVIAQVLPAEGEIEVDTGGEDGTVRYRRAAQLRFELPGGECELTLFRQLGYGGGLFLPFADATSGRTTYGGGRYLADTVKNTDAHCLEVLPGFERVLLDFNYAYNPSCAYDPRWHCPLTPPENRLAIPVEAGEKAAARARG